MKICPECASEYRQGVERCIDCGARLVVRPAEDSTRQTPSEPPPLVAIPGLDAAAAALLPGVLADGGFRYTVIESSGEIPDTVLVAESDLERVRSYLAEFRVRSAKGESVPIPWVSGR